MQKRWTVEDVLEITTPVIPYKKVVEMAGCSLRTVENAAKRLKIEKERFQPYLFTVNQCVDILNEIKSNRGRPKRDK